MPIEIVKSTVKIYGEADKDTKERPYIRTDEVEVRYEFPETLAEWVEKAGSEDIICNKIKSAVKIDLQGQLRLLANNDEITPEQYQEKVDAWSIPSGTSRTVSKIDKMGKLLAGMSKEDRAEALALLSDDSE